MQNCTSDHGEMSACCISTISPPPAVFLHAWLNNILFGNILEKYRGEKAVCRENAHDQSGLSTRESKRNSWKVHIECSTRSLFCRSSFCTTINQYIRKILLKGRPAWWADTGDTPTGVSPRWKQGKFWSILSTPRKYHEGRNKGICHLNLHWYGCGRCYYVKRRYINRTGLQKKSDGRSANGHAASKKWRRIWLM